MIFWAGDLTCFCGLWVGGNILNVNVVIGEAVEAMVKQE